MHQNWIFEHTHLKMAWIHHHIQQKDGYLSYYYPPPPPLPPLLPPPYLSTPSTSSSASSSSSSSSPSSGTRISPAVLFIIVILAVLFFISGVLHLLVRFLMKHPVFQYKEIVGLKEPFDCAVCLCEFSEKDNLRLLPMCSHAFHISCIDTWLLSNSTCPLCRGTLLTPGFSMENPMFDFDDMREDEGWPCDGENGFTNRQKKAVVEEINDEKRGIFPVRLGKFRKMDVETGEEGVVVGETSSSNLDARRCFSMGSYQYVVANSELRIALNHDRSDHKLRLAAEGKQHSEKAALEGDMDAKNIRSVSKGESFSVSKIWLWPKKGKFSSSSEAHIGMPSYLNSDMPRMREAEAA
ncbi:RING-H2 finger protein ATL46 [Arachis duranensis]|uniref:RING-type E3 ubiquitin transferase n=1 Tax=Arachis duranensis TaxID=130453 RepID=A0A6P4DEM4_ARADU|nr:RING-H2 finger protein ATL46 [Arachis duranensis]XP_015967105.1 RING-H2 finger protein ATL46 [Arachis duranensis]